MTAIQIARSWGMSSKRLIKLLRFDIDNGIYQYLLSRSGSTRFRSINHYALVAKKHYKHIRLNYAASPRH